MKSFVLSCESTVDFPYDYMVGRDVKILFYTYLKDNQTYEDDMGRTPGALDAFYKDLMLSNIPQTSQINVFDYTEYFRKLLADGDVLHISFGSGMTQSVQNAITAAEHLKEEYPDRRILVIDSLCSCCGYGWLVEKAADWRDEGLSLEETYEKAMWLREKIHHQFFSTSLDFYKRSGRISVTSATIGNLLGICPIMRLNRKGQIIAYDKVRGKQKAINRTVKEMEQLADGGLDYDEDIIICHSNCLKTAEELKEALLKHFPKIRSVRIMEIGMIIGAHCGPNTVAVYFIGSVRPDMK